MRSVRAVAAALLAVGCAVPACATDPAASAPGAVVARRWEERLGRVAQRHSLSCEARSACDLLAAHGIVVDEDRFLARLPRSPNPDLGFVGDPDGPGGGVPPDSYGVHAEPVAATLREFGLAAEAVRGADLAWLRTEVDAGRPVIVWATASLQVVPVVDRADPGGRRFRAVPGEHTFLAIGRRGRRIVLLDPASGETRSTPEDEFDAAWACLGKSAVRATGPRR